MREKYHIAILRYYLVSMSNRPAFFRIGNTRVAKLRFDSFSSE